MLALINLLVFLILDDGINLYLGTLKPQIENVYLTHFRKYIVVIGQNLMDLWVFKVVDFKIPEFIQHSKVKCTIGIGVTVYVVCKNVMV